MTKSTPCTFVDGSEFQNSAKNSEILDLKNTILNKLLILTCIVVVNLKNRLITYKILKKNLSQLPYLFPSNLCLKENHSF